MSQKMNIISFWTNAKAKKKCVKERGEIMREGETESKGEIESESEILKERESVCVCVNERVGDQPTHVML